MLNKCETLFCSARNFNYCSLPTYDNGSFPSPPLFTMGAPFLSLSDSRGRKKKGGAEGKSRRRHHRSLFFRHRHRKKRRKGNPLPIVVSLWGEGRKRLRSPWCSRKERGKRCYSAVAFIPLPWEEGTSEGSPPPALFPLAVV